MDDFEIIKTQTQTYNMYEGEKLILSNVDIFEIQEYIDCTLKNIKKEYKNAVYVNTLDKKLVICISEKNKFHQLLKVLRVENF